MGKESTSETTATPVVMENEAANEKAEKTKKMIKIAVIAVVVLVAAWVVWKKVLKK